MPGGIIDTTVSDDFSISMIGVYLIVEMKKLEKPRPQTDQFMVVENLYSS
jgi:hypothetical protein